MRRKDKEIKDRSIIEKIIIDAEICRLAMSDGNIPYIVPMNFGYKEDCLYFHCAKEGRKLDIIRKNPIVCFQVDTQNEIVKAQKPCEWSMKYYSVIGYGKADILEDYQAKKEALNVIMSKYTNEDTFDYKESAINSIAIIKVWINELSGKVSGHKNATGS
ncbi:MAG: pyridoxamine 5'-phosphate oxidase family protein [Bacillota bacterium]